MKSKSLFTKILGTLIFILLAASVVFLYYTYNHDKKFIDENSSYLYSGKIKLLIKTLEYKNNRLKATGMVSAYKEVFQKSALEIIKETYYDDNISDYPFILDSRNNILLFPKHMVVKKFYKHYFPNPSGTDTFKDYDGVVKWFMYETFNDWNWKIIWAVPESVKYGIIKERLSFNLKLSFFLSIGVILFTWLFVKQLIKPIEVLTEAAISMSQGKEQKEIEVKGSSEISLLANAFNEMNKAIYHQMRLIKQQEKEYKELVESSNSIILKWNSNGIITFLNSYGLNLFGYKKEEIIGKHIMDTIVSEKESTGRNLKELMKDILKNPEKYCLTINENICKNGKKAWIQWSNKALLDEDDNFIEMLSIGIDVTELKKLEEDLKQSQKMEVIGTLTGGIAHDFNNLLSVILGNAEIVKLKVTENNIINNINNIIEYSEKAKEIIRQILLYSRKNNDSKEIVNLKKVIDSSLTIIKSSAPSTVKIKKDIEHNLYVFANEIQLNQVIMNMCSNALHAMEEKGGILSIKAHKEFRADFDIPDKEYIHLTIKDTGCGIKNENLNKIFDPYFTTKDMKKGTGIGLSIVSGIVSSLNGYIFVESEVGVGTIFDVFLPVCENTCFNNIDKDNSVLDYNLNGLEKIVLVDDEECILDSTSILLKEFGYDVSIFMNGKDALEFIRKNPNGCQILITDLTMPEMTGEELAKIVYKEYPKIKIIICSGYKDRIKNEAFFEENIKFLQKPVALHELLKQIRNLLDNNYT